MNPKPDTRNPIPAAAMLLLFAFAASRAAAAEPQGLSLVPAQPVLPEKVTATGRIQPQITSRLGARVSGTLKAFGVNADRQALDAGMSVKVGDVLFTLDTTTFEKTKAVADAALASAEANFKNLTAKTRPERLTQLRSAVAELKSRLADRVVEEQRYIRLVEQDKSMPPRRLEEIRLEISTFKAQLDAAQARFDEADKGPTETEIAVAAARVAEAKAALQVAENDLKDATVRAPFSGLITKRFKSAGDYLVNMPPTEVLELVSSDKLEAELRLPEAYLPAITEGKTPVAMKSPLLKSPLSAVVTRIIGDVDPARGTFPIRVAIPADQRQGLIAGAFVTADLSLESTAMGVMIPFRAVVMHDNQPTVLVAKEGKIARRVVELGERLTENVIARSGLAAGESVLVGPLDEVKDGDSVPSYLLKK